MKILENDANRRYLLDNLEKEQLANMVLIKMDIINALKKVLEPFVTYADAVRESWPDDTSTSLLFKQPNGELKHNPTVTLGDCRKVKVLLISLGLK